MQYAFKGQHGTTMCTLAMKETIKYYLQNGSDVYICLIDASKAFDRVRHDMLFQLLIERGILAGGLRTLLDSYERQRLRTVWNDCSLEIFETQNGIKQGSIASPVLFTIYMDQLLNILENSGLRGHIGAYFYGAFGYADDLTLFIPTVNGLQKSGEYL